MTYGNAWGNAVCGIAPVPGEKCFRVAISYKHTPNDHTSALVVDKSPPNTSGAQYLFVPAAPNADSSFSTTMLNPKSANLHV